jgi:hypothetical protein
LKRAAQALLAAGALATSVAACSLALDFDALECAPNQKACDGGCVDLDAGCGPTPCDHCFDGGAVARCSPDGSCVFVACRGSKQNCGDSDAEPSCVDTDSDLHHCGSCDNDCTKGPHGAAMTCAGGHCVLRCDPPMADCDQNPDNGCETDLRNLGGVCDAGVKIEAELPHGIAVLDKTVYWAEDLDGGDGKIRSGPSGAVVCPGVSLPETLSYAPGDRKLFFVTHEPRFGDIVRYSPDTGTCDHLWTDQSTRYGRMMVRGDQLYFGTWYGIDGGPASGSVLVGDLDSGAGPDVLVPAPSGCNDTSCGVHSVLVDSHNLWWTDSYKGALYQADLDGTGATIVSHVAGAGFLVADADFVYFSGYEATGGIYAVEKAHPTNPARPVASGLTWPDVLALDGDYIYWTSSSTVHPADCDAGLTGGIWRVRKDAKNGTPALVASPASPWSIAIENGTLYYTDTGCVGGRAYVVAVPLGDGGTP